MGNPSYVFLIICVNIEVWSSNLTMENSSVLDLPADQSVQGQIQGIAFSSYKDAQDGSVRCLWPLAFLLDCGARSQ